MSSSVQRTDSGAIKLTDGKVQVTLDLPLPALFCESVSASKSKCGFLTVACDGDYKEAGDCVGVPDLTDSKYYLTKNYSNIVNNDDCPPIENCMDFLSGDCIDPDFTCPTWCCFQTGIVSTLASESYSSDNDCEDLNTENEDLAAQFSCCGRDDNPIPGDPICPHDPGCPGACIFPDTYTLCSTVSTTIYYSNEYSTDVLISRTEDDLPDYANNWICNDDNCDTSGPCGFYDSGQGCSCSASYDLSDDENSLAIQNFQYLFAADDPPPAGAVLVWVERFTPDDPETGDPDPGAAVDNQKSFPFDGSLMQTNIFECAHPNSNGEITLEDIYWQ